MKVHYIIMAVLSVIFTGCSEKPGAPNLVTSSNDPDFSTMPSSDVKASYFGSEMSFESMNGTWTGRCWFSNFDGKGNQSVYKINLTKDGVGTVETISYKFSDSECLNDKNQDISTIQKYTHLSGHQKVSVYQSFRLDDTAPGIIKPHIAEGFLHNVDTFKFETKVTQVDGVPSFDGREGHTVMRVFIMGKNTPVLLSTGRYIHPNNNPKEKKEWAGRDVIKEYVDNEDAASDSFRKIKFDSLNFK